MRTLHFGLHVADLPRSLGFYRGVGYEIVGQVPETPLGHLTMLKLPGDELVTLELVHDPAGPGPAGGGGLSHLVIQVDVETPTHLTARQRELLEEFRSLETGEECPQSTGFFQRLKGMIGADQAR